MSVAGRWLLRHRSKGGRYLQGRPDVQTNRSVDHRELAMRVAAARGRWQQGGVARPAADLLLDSASGVDPHISLAAALQQVPRLAAARGMAPQQLERLLRQHLEGPGGLRAIEPGVNVLGLALRHISEPTRLRRISDAVLCLKKKNT